MAKAELGAGGRLGPSLEAICPFSGREKDCRMRSGSLSNPWRPTDGFVTSRVEDGGCVKATLGGTRPSFAEGARVELKKKPSHACARPHRLPVLFSPPLHSLHTTDTVLLLAANSISSPCSSSSSRSLSLSHSHSHAWLQSMLNLARNTLKKVPSFQELFQGKPTMSKETM